MVHHLFKVCFKAYDNLAQIMLGLRTPAVLIFVLYLRKRTANWVGILPLPSLWSGSLCLFLLPVCAPALSICMAMGAVGPL
jgi:hypothetical protein